MTRLPSSVVGVEGLSDPTQRPPVVSLGPARTGCETAPPPGRQPAPFGNYDHPEAGPENLAGVGSNTHHRRPSTGGWT
jgi:hypothetical protein